MEVSYATMIAMGTLVQRLGRDARRLEKALAETMNASAEWRRIVDELKAERDAERKAHNEYKERNRELFNQNQRLTAELVVIKDERDALRAQLDTERKAKTIDVPQAHSVKVPDWVRRTAFEHGPNTKIGTVAKVVDVDIDGDYRVAINDTEVCWRPAHCTPCDPSEATHDTPEGRASAESVIRDDRKTAPDEIKVGEVVRATFWKAGQAAVVKEILADGRLMLDCSDQPWRVDEVVKLMRKVTP